MSHGVAKRPKLSNPVGKTPTLQGLTNSGYSTNCAALKEKEINMFDQIGNALAKAGEAVVKAPLWQQVLGGTVLAWISASACKAFVSRMRNSFLKDVMTKQFFKDNADRAADFVERSLPGFFTDMLSAATFNDVGAGMAAWMETQGGSEVAIRNQAVKAQKLHAAIQEEMSSGTDNAKVKKLRKQLQDTYAETNKLLKLWKYKPLGFMSVNEWYTKGKLVETHMGMFFMLALASGDYMTAQKLSMKKDDKSIKDYADLHQRDKTAAFYASMGAFMSGILKKLDDDKKVTAADVDAEVSEQGFLHLCRYAPDLELMTKIKESISGNDSEIVSPFDVFDKKILVNAQPEPTPAPAQSTPTGSTLVEPVEAVNPPTIEKK